MKIVDHVAAIRDRITTGRMERSLQARPRDWNTLCSALDVLEDTELALDSYLAFPSQEDFGPQVVGLARERGLGILVLKAQCRGRWSEGAVRTHEPCWYEPVVDPTETRLALSFALAQGATACLPPGNEELFWTGVEAAAQVGAWDRASEQQLRALQAGAIPLFRYATAE